MAHTAVAMIAGMTNGPLVNLYALSRMLRVSAGWLKSEATAGRIPCLKAGKQLLFNPAAVEAALASRAATGTGVACAH